MFPFCVYLFHEELRFFLRLSEASRLLPLLRWAQPWRSTGSRRASWEKRHPSKTPWWNSPLGVIRNLTAQNIGISWNFCLRAVQKTWKFREYESWSTKWHQVQLLKTPWTPRIPLLLDQQDGMVQRIACTSTNPWTCHSNSQMICELARKCHQVVHFSQISLSNSFSSPKNSSSLEWLQGKFMRRSLNKCYIQRLQRYEGAKMVFLSTSHRWKSSGGDPRQRSLERHCSKQVGENWILDISKDFCVEFLSWTSACLFPKNDSQSLNP